MSSRKDAETKVDGVENSSISPAVLIGAMEATAIVIAGMDQGAMDVDAVTQNVSKVGKAFLDLARSSRDDSPADGGPLKGVVSIKDSLASDEHILSMLDGKPYKVLKRHIRSHGMDPDEYRRRFGLPSDYPMVAKNYSKRRSSMARDSGLGRSG